VVRAPGGVPAGPTHTAGRLVRVLPAARCPALAGVAADGLARLEAKCAYTPLLLMPIAAARFPIDRPSSPSTVASDAAARKIELRVRFPSERVRP
jgi:hypothetical protein